MVAADLQILLRDAQNRFREIFRDQIEKSIKKLLATKHLYQSITVDHESLVLKERVNNINSLKVYKHEEYTSYIKQVLNWPWIPRDNSRDVISEPGGELYFYVPHIKLHCINCGQKEAFNSISAEEFLGREMERGQNIKNFSHKNDRVQIYIFSFRCQVCRGVPEVFIVRRQAAKMTLSGRSPMEYVKEPKYIPENVKKYYSGAIVARQTGHTLAGLFYLRTLIEQWIRSLENAPQDKSDEFLDWYKGMLPDDFNSRFPSLKRLYNKLSVFIHNADESTENFDKSIQDIDKHFDARRVFGLNAIKADTTNSSSNKELNQGAN